MCSWCWGFKPVLAELLNSLPKDIEVKRVLGGLAIDSNESMPDEMRSYLQNTWHKIQSKIPNTKFNFDFWTQCEPRRSTWPACRAVIAARQQGDCFDVQMTVAIQKAYYLQARNPSDDNVLIDLAIELGLDKNKFTADFKSEATQQQLNIEIAQSENLNAQAFPSLVYDNNGSIWPIPIDYLSTKIMLDLINQIQDD